MKSTSDGDILGAHFSRFLVPRVVTDRLGNDDSVVRLTISARKDLVRSAAEALAMQMGALIATEPDIVAKVGTGLFGLNPAVLRLRLTEEAEAITTMEVSATAKEGLIKQHGGHQAVGRFVDRFRGLAPTEWGI